MLINAAKFQGYSFYRFWVIEEKPTGEGVKLSTTHPPRLGLSIYQWKWIGKNEFHIAKN